MKPFNRVFVVIYYVVGFIAGILHPVTVEGMDRLPDSGVLLCPNHASNWDPILISEGTANGLISSALPF